MARVITAIPPKEKRAVCKDGCGKTIGYVPNDLKKRYGTCGPENETYIGLVCPNCKKFITLETR